MNALRCSVVIPTRNRAALLEKCLSALAKQEMSPDEMEIIVVDDNSTDDTSERARSAKARMPFKLCVLQGEGRGPAAARNLGWRAAKAPVILFTDDDCEPALRRSVDLTNFLEKNPTFAGVGGAIRRIRESGVARYVDDEGYLDHPGDREDVRYLVSANAAYRAEWLAKVAGFNESFPCAGGEDPELSFRMRARGARLAKIDGGLVLHHHPRTMLDIYRMNWRYGRGAFNLTKAGYDHSGTGKPRDVLGWWKQSVKSYLRRSDLRAGERLSFSVHKLVGLFGLWRGYCYQAKQ
jgi:glycosyltransferase involved in cell wall biosynthesis